MNDKGITLQVNGKTYLLETTGGKTLLDVLREDLELRGTKCGCDMGECGTCTVLMDGQPVLSCLIPAVSAQVHEITTIEGLNGEEDRRLVLKQEGGSVLAATEDLLDDRGLHPLQQAFVDHGAIQCGFCTPGMILSAKALLDRNPNPGEEEIRQAISGNLCRCTGYVKIVEAIKSCAGNAEKKVSS